MLRPLAHFFLIGALLFTAKAVYEGRSRERTEIAVGVSNAATPAEVDAAVREVILLNEAKRYGWDRRDPIVFTHLVRNMRFIEPESAESDLALYQRALDMNLQAHDPVVRARLLYRAREALSLVPEDRMPSRKELAGHLAANADRFEREGRLRFQHVFLSRSKRAASLSSDATAMREQLSELGAAAPRGLGDPLPGLRSEQYATASELRNDYGAALASLVDEAILGVWRGPVGSVYGLHFVKVVEREPAHVPSLDVIFAEVRADRLAGIREELAEERMALLRDQYEVRIERSP